MTFSWGAKAIQQSQHTGHAPVSLHDAPDLEGLLLEHFGWSSFRSIQRDVIESVLRGNSCLTVLPTGGGKSLCYQLPALALPGITLVISPLISLMKDQVDALTERKIAAVAINSQDTAPEMERKLADIQAGTVRLVYVAPERLKNGAFMETCRLAHVSLIAVDEAHCVSQWGHDFRPDYRFISDFRRQVGDPPLLALTATATRRVQQDIATHLGIKSGEQFLGGVDRPNLWLGLERCKTVAEKRGKILSLVERTEGSTIVYVSSRRDADELASLLESTLNEPVAAYHAGLSPTERTSVQNRFMAGLIRVVTATNAFGMGIDKPDIRAVIHAGIPESIEAYYQEVGRAGRDGNPAECAMVVVPGMDVKMREYLLEKDEPTRDQVEGLVQRVMQVSGQGEGIIPLDDQDATMGTLILSHLQASGHLELLQRTNNGMRVRMTESIGPDTRGQVWAQIQGQVRAKRDRFRRLRNFIYLDPDTCRREFLMQYFDERPASETAACCSACEPRPVVARRIGKEKPTVARRRRTDDTPRRHNADPDLLETLKAWRWSKATERAVPAYVIFGDRDLEGIAAALPTSLDELAACRGVGPTKLGLYGEEILSLIRSGSEARHETRSAAVELFKVGKSPMEAAVTLDCTVDEAWDHLLAWVTETKDDAWKDSVRNLLSPEEYVAIRAQLRGRMQEPLQDIVVNLSDRFEARKIALTRAVMMRVGES